MTVKIGGAAVDGGKSNGVVVEPEKKKREPKVKGPTRAEKVAKIIADGSPFSFVEKRVVQSFKCICGSTGQNAIVMKDKGGNEVLAGASCAKKCGIEAPKIRTKKQIDL